MNPIRIGKVAREDGVEFVVVELFGATLASSSTMVESFDTEPDFVDYWSACFMAQIVSMLAEGLHEKRYPRGWLMETRTVPRSPKLPDGGGEE